MRALGTIISMIFILLNVGQQDAKLFFLEIKLNKNKEPRGRRLCLLHFSLMGKKISSE